MMDIIRKKEVVTHSEFGMSWPEEHPDKIGATEQEKNDGTRFIVTRTGYQCTQN